MTICRTVFLLLPGLAMMAALSCAGNLVCATAGVGEGPGPIVAAAEPWGTQALTVRNAWSRATAPGAPVGVVYFEIVNTGAADELLGIESAAARRVEMHSTMTMGGMMEMRPAETIVVPAAGRVRFEPGGLHAMLKGMKQPLVEGAKFPLTLVFRHAGRVAVQAVVLDPGATTGPADRDR